METIKAGLVSAWLWSADQPLFVQVWLGLLLFIATPHIVRGTWWAFKQLAKGYADWYRELRDGVFSIGRQIRALLRPGPRDQPPRR
jgi:hypothetical protein